MEYVTRPPLAAPEPSHIRRWIRCRKCKHVWFPRTADEVPTRCANPACRSTTYAVPSIVRGIGTPRKHQGGPLLQCQRCTYEWFGRVGQELPLNCPGCDSPYWRVPRRRAVKQRAKARPKGRQQAKQRRRAC